MRLTHKVTAEAIVPLAALGIGLGVSQGATAAAQPRAPVVHTAAIVQRAPFAGEALHTMSVYYRDINWQNYAGAWEQFGLQPIPFAQGGPINPVTHQTYGQFVAGYATTANVNIQPYRDVTTATADTTYINITATQTSGQVLTYTGWYMVNGSGVIVAAHVVQTGSAPAPQASTNGEELGVYGMPEGATVQITGTNQYGDTVTTPPIMNTGSTYTMNNEYNSAPFVVQNTDTGGVIITGWWWHGPVTVTVTFANGNHITVVYQVPVTYSQLIFPINVAS
jgi:hypothetical protein